MAYILVLSLPGYFREEAHCIHKYETYGYVGNESWHLATGNGYAGGFQFLLSTWNSIAGGIVPRAQTLQQIARMDEWTQFIAAYRVWKRDHYSWKEWGTAHDCGLH